MFTNVIDLLKFQVINNFINFTSNDFIDKPIQTIFFIMIISSIYYLYNNHDYIKKYYLRNNYNSIVLEGKRHFNSNRIYSKYDELYTLKFRAIWWYINKNIKNINISSLKEYNNSSSDTNDYGDKINKNIIKNNDYIVNQIFPFNITNKIKCKIEILNNHIDTNNDKSKHIIEDNIIVYLYSNKIKLIEMMKFVNFITEEYQEMQNINRNNKLFIYSLSLDQNNNYDDDYYNSNKIKHIWVESEFKSNKTFDNLFFKNKTEIIEKINKFCNNESIYDKFGIPYTLGILLEGPPGTGKTSFIKALSNYLNRHLIIINSNSIKTNAELNKIFYESTYNSNNEQNSINFKKKIYIFEDIDCTIDIIKKRDNKSDELIESDSESDLESDLDKKNKKKNDKILKDIIKSNMEKPDKLKLGYLLNLIDGIKETPGRIMIITSNYVEKIDPALIRPGRIDIHLKLENINFEVLTDMYNYYYNENIDNIKEFIKEKEINLNDVSTAYITGIFKNSINSDDFIQNLLKSLN